MLFIFVFTFLLLLIFTDTAYKFCVKGILKFYCIVWHVFMKATSNTLSVPSLGSPSKATTSLDSPSKGSLALKDASPKKAADVKGDAAGKKDGETKTEEEEEPVIVDCFPAIVCVK